MNRVQAIEPHGHDVNYCFIFRCGGCFLILGVEWFPRDRNGRSAALRTSAQANWKGYPVFLSSVLLLVLIWLRLLLSPRSTHPLPGTSNIPVSYGQTLSGGLTIDQFLTVHKSFHNRIKESPLRYLFKGGWQSNHSTGRHFKIIKLKKTFSFSGLEIRKCSHLVREHKDAHTHRERERWGGWMTHRKKCSHLSQCDRYWDQNIYES